MTEKLLSKLPEPKLALFDMDGVLFDTMPTHARSWKQAMDYYKITSDEREFYLYEGMKGKDTIANLYKREFGELPSEELVEEIYNFKCKMFDEDEDFVLERIPGALELMAFLSEERNCDIAVVTGSTIRNAHHRIEKHYSKYVPTEHIITADIVTHGKPHPEPYLRGMELFGRKPEETLVIENAPLGVQSGANSGALTAAVMTGPVPECILREEGADLVFSDMYSLQLWWQFTYE